MAKLENVVQLNLKQENNKNVYGTIHTFLLRKGQNSENTKKTYERAIRDFFRTMRNKELEDLTVEDIIFTKEQIESYQVALKERYKSSTVNNAMTALKECYQKLEDNNFPISSTLFRVERYSEYDSESYDTLTHEEIISIIALVSETRKGSEKALLVRLAYATAFRKETLLNITWNQIVEIDGQRFAKVLGKGNKWSHKKISDDLYLALMEHKASTDGEKIFKLTHKTINKMMNYIRENIDFGDRKIVFHSFKKASIEEVSAITGGDIKAMASHGDHNDARTTINSYVAKKKLEDLVTVDINTHVPVEAFDELSREDLLSLVKNIDRNTQIKLLRKLGAM